MSRDVVIFREFLVNLIVKNGDMERILAHSIPKDVNGFGTLACRKSNL